MEQYATGIYLKVLKWKYVDAVYVCEHHTKTQKATDLRTSNNGHLSKKTQHHSYHLIFRIHIFFHVEFERGLSI
jgi:hypothetical protein